MKAGCRCPGPWGRAEGEGAMFKVRVTAGLSDSASTKPLLFLLPFVTILHLGGTDAFVVVVFEKDQ